VISVSFAVGEEKHPGKRVKMPIRDLDSEQQLAATSLSDEVAVSSGAGSGKTRVLVGRYLHILNSEHILISEMAAITFTNKAANQMKSRIASGASKLAEQYPALKAMWNDVAEKIYTAPISTIHAFCNSILRSYPAQAEIDPQFEILDDSTSSQFLQEALSGFLENRYDEDPERMGFLLRAIGTPGLREILLQLLSRRAYMVKWIDEHGVPTCEQLRLQYRRYILNRLDNYIVMFRDFHAARPGEDSLSSLLPAALDCAVRIRGIVDSDITDKTSIQSYIKMIQDNIPKLNKNIKEAWYDQEVSPEQVTEGMKEYIGFLKMIDVYNSHEKETTPRMVSSLIQEYVRLEEYFLKLKKNWSCFDHDDTLIETWRLLRSRPDVCRKVAGAFKHILVDEFQDTDNLQLDILRMIAGNSSAKLFTVGDPKQSIYRFRGADVTVFNHFKSSQSVDYLPLSTNYRSTPAVIDFVNHVFGKIMGFEDTGNDFEVVYKEMKTHRKREIPGSKVEIAVFEGKSDNRRELEGDFIAAKARELKEKYGYSYGQMALLLRKGTQTKKYEEAFLNCGIPFVNLAGGNPFSSPESYDIANLLGWLSDPEDQVLFAAVLLSPMCGLDSDVLYGLKKKAGEISSLSETFLNNDISCEEWAQGKNTLQIQTILRNLLILRGRRTIRELLEQAFDETGYTLTLLADPLRGEMSLGILDLILRTSDTFQSKGGTLREFARLLRNEEIKTDSSETMENPGDSLSIFTIHKAKGMEYKVVFLADIASRPRNDPRPFLFHEDLGPGFSYRDLTGKTVRMMSSELASEQEKLKDIAESKRLFYVACTRAEDHLIITGGKPHKKGDPGYEKDNWMSWIHSALSLTPDGRPMEDCPLDLFNYSIIEEECGEKKDPGVERWETILSESRIFSSSQTEGAPMFPLPLPVRYSGKPETLSPTQILDYLKCPALYFFKNVYNLHPCLSDDRKESFGYRYGILAHRALEQWDYVDKNILIRSVDFPSEKELPLPLRESLKTHLSLFAESGLCRFIAASEEIRKEEPFAFLNDDVLIRGVMDVKLRTGNSVAIIDFKTDFGEEDIENLVKRYETQMYLYALAVVNAENILPSRLVLHFLTPGISRDIPCEEEDINDISSLLSKTIASLDKGDFNPHHTGLCKSCPWNSLCRDCFR
jgi:ATP-dependent helicase/nuclease subunit A